MESEELENLAKEHGEEMSERKSPGGTDSAGPRRPVQEAEGRGHGRGSRGEALRANEQGQGTFQSIRGVRLRQQAFWAAGSSQLPQGVTKRLLGLVWPLKGRGLRTIQSAPTVLSLHQLS